MTAVVSVDKLAKTFRRPFSGRKVEAVRGVSFDVTEGEVFGFVGPNGAGKTTSIKMLTGLIFPTSGRATIFGQEIPSPKAMARVGFLPENPYVYPYLTPREFVTLCGRLSGMSGSKLDRRVVEILGRVGMAEAIDRPVQALSKGMGQRVGLASALVHDPDLLILDEPMSGLDPVGRKDVRDLILEERERGKTVFFSTHILSDVEQLCDRVCILRKGEVVVSGKLLDLLETSKTRTEIALENVDRGLAKKLTALNAGARARGDHLVCEVEGYAAVQEIIEAAHAGGARIARLEAKRETLESLFVRRAL